MKHPLNCILLVDDNPDDNLFHERVIRKTGCTKNIVAKQSGKAALEYLRSKADHPEAHPDLIFLDINMPGMNGWEFLDAYNLLDDPLKSRVVVVMLTTSVNPDDREKANTILSISSFQTKPLTVKILLEILQEHFEERL